MRSNMKLKCLLKKSVTLQSCESLRLLDCSPLKKHARTDRAFNHGKRKIEDFTKKFHSAAVVALTELGLENDDRDSCLSLVKDIKEKLYPRDFEILGWVQAGPVLPHREKVPL